ncbi:hypothetical protein GCM10020254_42410 [Streptomyces goshikiensis]
MRDARTPPRAFANRDRGIRQVGAARPSSRPPAVHILDNYPQHMNAEAAASLAGVKDADRKHVFHSWSAQELIDPLAVAGAAGSYFWDYEGKRYLDFSSALVYTNIGYQHPKVAAAIAEQAGKLCTVAPGFAVDVRSEAARLIAERTPGDLDKIFFTNAGAEAVENAVRMARLHTGRPKVLSAYRSYHGATATAINLTGDARRFGNDTATAGVVRFWGPYLYRSPFHATTEAEECARALTHLEDTIVFEGPQSIAAIILETVGGAPGVLVPPGRLSGGGPRALRPLRDRLRPGRGHGRLRAHRHLVRRRQLGGHPPTSSASPRA